LWPAGAGGVALKYLMMHRFDETVGPPSGDPTPEELEEERAMDAWAAEMEERGVTLYGGFLRPAADAVTVRVRDGQVLCTDGPFAETKEQIAGFNVLDCVSKEEVIEIAARHPVAKVGTFELRPFASG
jgi:hypothetical protein